MRSAIIVGIFALTVVLAACAAPTPTPTPTPFPDVIPTPRIADTPTPVVVLTPTPPRLGTPTPQVFENSTGGVIYQYAEPPQMVIDPNTDYTARLRTTEGDIVIQLLPADAPIAVNNFVFLARQGFYDGLIFHRVIPNFMIQGGDPLGNGTGGPGYQFEDEFASGDTFDTPGIVAMANAGPNTSSSSPRCRRRT